MDVGGRRKGFHAALIDDDRLLRLERLTAVADAVAWLRELAADLVAIDSPRDASPAGREARAGERAVATSICNIRWTPDRARLDSNPEYYEWIEHGFELYDACVAAGLQVIECFPTASWTRWAGRGATRLVPAGQAKHS